MLGRTTASQLCPIARPPPNAAKPAPSHAAKPPTRSPRMLMLDSPRLIPTDSIPTTRAAADRRREGAAALGRARDGDLPHIDADVVRALAADGAVDRVDPLDREHS